MSRYFGIYLATGMMTALAVLVAPVRAATSYDFGNPSGDEEYMRQLIHRARTDPEVEADLDGLDNDHPHDIPNGTYDVGEGITNSGVSDQRTYWSRYQGFRQPVAWSAALNAAAANHSDDMYTFNFFSHYSGSSSNHGYSSGDGPGDRGFAEGYPNHFVFENIAVNTGLGYFSVEDVHFGLFEDTTVPGRGHRKNILHSFHREVGIGYTSHSSPNPGGWRDHWTIDFATDTFIAYGHSGEDDDPDTVYVTGVVFDDTSSDGAFQSGEQLPGVEVYVFESGGAELLYYATTADGGGYSVPLLKDSGADVAAGEQIEVTFFDPIGKRYCKAMRTVQAGNVVFEDTEAETPTTFYQRFNVGLNVVADDLETVLDGDATLDGTVSGADYTIYAANYNQAGRWCDGDFTGDGLVTGADYTIYAANYGSALVPEPTVMMLLCLGAAGLIRRR